MDNKRIRAPFENDNEPDVQFHTAVAPTYEELAMIIVRFTHPRDIITIEMATTKGVPKLFDSTTLGDMQVSVVCFEVDPTNEDMLKGVVTWTEVCKLLCGTDKRSKSACRTRATLSTSPARLAAALGSKISEAAATLLACQRGEIIFNVPGPVHYIRYETQTHSR